MGGGRKADKTARSPGDGPPSAPGISRALPAALDLDAVRLGELLTAAGDGIWDYDLRSGRVRHSQGWYAMVGYAVDEASARSGVPEPWGQAIHPEDRAAAREAIERHLAGVEPIYRAVFRIRAADGAYRWILSRGKVFERDRDGAPLRAVGTHMDISEWHALDERYRATERRRAALLRSIRDLVFLVRRDGTVLDYYAAREELLVAPPGTFLNRNMREVLPLALAERFLRLFAAVLDEDRPQSIEYSLEVRGNLRYFEALVTPYEEDVVSSAVRDVTDAVRTRQEMRRIQERLLQAERTHSIGKLAGGMAHDFNNQVSSLVFLADLLKKNADDPGKVHQYADMMVRRAGASSDLTRRLLAFARRQSADTVPTDFHVLLREVIALVEYTFEKTIAVEARLEAPRSWVSADPSQLENALLNLALNARDAMPAGGTLRFTTDNVSLPAGHCQLLGTEVAAGEHLRITVEDTGTGIDPEIVPRLFEPFVSSKDPDKGCGLGLTSVADTVRVLRGMIEVSSTLGEGSVFTICLPVLAGPASEAAPEGTGDMRGSGRILVVDDDPLFRDVMAEHLCAAGYEVMLCADGPSAVRACEQSGRGIDAVVLDVIMPGMDGWQVLRRLRCEDPEIRILLVSGTPLESAQGPGGMGANNPFLQKPFTPRQLQCALAALLGDGSPAPSSGAG
ncbi:MAG: PAS domain-containing protein [Lentisphaeria bacterium]|nr:PAS domain-containing protein [Lentisphaeria bacterium]